MEMMFSDSIDSVDTVLLISPAPFSGLQNTLPNSTVANSQYKSNEMDYNYDKSMEDNLYGKQVGLQFFDGVKKLIKVGVPEQQIDEKEEDMNFKLKTQNVDSESLAWIALSQYNNAIEESVQQLSGLFDIVDNFEKDVESKLFSIQQFIDYKDKSFISSGNNSDGNNVDEFQVYGSTNACPDTSNQSISLIYNDGRLDYSKMNCPYSESKSKVKKRLNLPQSARKIMREWLDNHLMFPYPTEKEKLEMSKVAQISLNQLNNWFINARRRPTARLAQAQKMAQKMRGGRGKRSRSLVLESDDFEVIRAAC